MSDVILMLVIAASFYGLFWAQRNRHNPHALQTAKAKAQQIDSLYLVEKGLLFAAGLMGSLFAFNLFSGVHPILGYLVGAAVIIINFAESFLIRLAIAASRHGFRIASYIASFFVLIIMIYSITAGTNTFESAMSKNQDLQLAAQYEIAASQGNIEAAKAGVLKETLKAQAKDPYDYLNNPDIASAKQKALTYSAQENARIAEILKNKQPEFKGALLDKDAIAFIIALALEGSILGVVIFGELFNKPTPLPALIKFANKDNLDWNINPHHLNNLAIEKSPALGTVGLPHHPVAVGFSGFGWQPNNPTVEVLETHAHSEPSVPSVHPEPSVPSAQAEPSVPRAHGSEQTATLGRGLDITRRGMTLQKMAEPPRPVMVGDIALAPETAQNNSFNEWLDAVKHGDIEPTLAPAKRFISERKLAKGITLIGAMANDWLERAFNLGVIELSADQGNGKAKYCRKVGEVV